MCGVAERQGWYVLWRPWLLGGLHYGRWVLAGSKVALVSVLMVSRNGGGLLAFRNGGTHLVGVLCGESAWA